MMKTITELGDVKHELKRYTNKFEALFSSETAPFPIVIQQLLPLTDDLHEKELLYIIEEFCWMIQPDDFLSPGIVSFMETANKPGGFERFLEEMDTVAKKKILVRIYEDCMDIANVRLFRIQTKRFQLKKSFNYGDDSVGY